MSDEETFGGGVRDEERGFNAIEAAALWAEEKHMTAIVDKPHANILFAKQLATEAFLGGFNSALDAVLEMINKSEYAFDTVGGSKRLTALIQHLRAEKDDGK